MNDQDSKLKQELVMASFVLVLLTGLLCNWLADCGTGVWTLIGAYVLLPYLVLLGNNRLLISLTGGLSTALFATCWCLASHLPHSHWLLPMCICSMVLTVLGAGGTLRKFAYH